MQVVRTRAVAVLCSALAVVVMLSGCQSKVGAAAVVDGQRISESGLNDYVDAQAPTASQGRSFALIFLVKSKLYERVLSRRGGLPAAGALAGYHDQAIGQVLSSQLGAGAAADTSIGQILAGRGVKSSFTPVVVRAAELEWFTYLQLKLAPAAFFPAVAKLGIPVSVSPRYGSWNPATQDLAAPVTPSFLTLSPTQAPAAGAAPTTSTP